MSDFSEDDFEFVSKLSESEKDFLSELSETEMAFLNDLLFHNNGVVTAEAVMAAAAPLESPIHDRFLWDDEKAAQMFVWSCDLLGLPVVDGEHNAELYRMSQARRMARLLNGLAVKSNGR